MVRCERQGGRMQAYSLDLRERVVDDRVAGLRTAEVARKYRVSPAWVRRLLHRYRATGQVAPKRRTQYRAPLLQPYLQHLAAVIEAQPDATLAELRAALGVPVSPHGVARRAPPRPARKKKSCTPRNKTALMSWRPASAGGPKRPTSMGTAWSSWTRRPCGRI